MRGRLYWIEYLLVLWFIVVYVFYFHQFTGLFREVLEAVAQSFS